MVTSVGRKPTDDTRRMLFVFAVTEKFPCSSVVVPWDVPLICTEAPWIGIPCSSVIRPVTIRSCCIIGEDDGWLVVLALRRIIVPSDISQVMGRPVNLVFSAFSKGTLLI